MTDHQAIARAFMDALWAADMDAADALLSNDATWQFQLGMPQAALPGHGRTWPAREAIRRIVADLFGRFDPEGFTVTVTQTLSGSGSVGIEYEARGRTASGERYQNYYVTVLDIRNDKVTEVRPYNDTAHMLAALS